MSTQLGAINTLNALIGKVFKQPKGDLADRLNTRLTVTILGLSSVLLLSGQFFGDPIQCWTPAQFTKDWTTFVNQYCYVHGTYFVPLDTELSFDEEERKKVPVTYYQWVPYILAVQAFLFYLPRFVWKTLCSLSGFDIAGAIRYVDDFWTAVKGKDDTFQKRIAHFEGRPAVYIFDALRLAKQKGSHDLPLYYTLGTVLQAANAWVQFYWVNSVIDSPMYTFWGPNVLTDIVTGADWQSTGHFPRITHCDFNRRRPASVQLDTVLCVLSMNIYYEKVFVFLWFWILFVAIISTGNAIYWAGSMFLSSRARRSLHNYMDTDPNDSTNTERQRFFDILGRDGLFVLQHMTLNLGDLPASYLAIAMRNIAPHFEQKELEEVHEKRRLLHSAKDV